MICKCNTRAVFIHEVGKDKYNVECMRCARDKHEAPINKETVDKLYKHFMGIEYISKK